MTRADQIQSEFPPGVAMPAALRALCDLLDRIGYPISGYMRLRPEGRALRAWFGENTDACRELAGFGSGPDGSILAFWLSPQSDISNAPIVHLGSEGGNLEVLANDIEDFLRLFAIGYNELGFDDLSLPPDEPESAEALRAWLFSEFGLTPPATGIGIATRAKALHPDFEAWVAEALERSERT